MGALRTGLTRGLRRVLTVLSVALGLVLLFLFKYLVLLVLGTYVAMLIALWPVIKPRLSRPAHPNDDGGSAL